MLEYPGCMAAALSGGIWPAHPLPEAASPVYCLWMQTLVAVLSMDADPRCCTVYGGTPLLLHALWRYATWAELQRAVYPVQEIGRGEVYISMRVLNMPKSIGVVIWYLHEHYLILGRDGAEVYPTAHAQQVSNGDI